MKIILLILLVLSLPMVGCLGKTYTPKSLTVDRPYRYILEDGKSVKETIRFPDLRWYNLPTESCISRAEIIDLTTYIIQLNMLIDEYEEIFRIKKEGD